jgi:F-type H+-transporting ATPase subunit delta
MANGSLARRYARALILLGQESDCVEQYAADMDTFALVLELGDGLLRDTLSNPGLTHQERTGVLTDVLAKLKLSTTSANFLRLLVDKNRFGAFEDIRRATHEMADEIAGRVRATVTTASALAPASAKDVKAALEQATGKTVLVDFQTDEALIGGMVAQVGDVSYDASIAARLSALQSALIRNPGSAAADA